MIIRDPQGKEVANVASIEAYFELIEAKSGTVIPAELREQYTVEASDQEKKVVIRNRVASEVGDLPDIVADLSDITQVTSRLLMRFLLALVETDNIATARANVKADPDFAALKALSEAMEAGDIRLTGNLDDLGRQFERISTICDIMTDPIVIA